ETLLGDFRARAEPLATVAAAPIDVLAHNVETTEPMTRRVRDGKSGYRQSLAALREMKRLAGERLTKSSIMLGLGETEADVRATLRDLKDVGVDVVTFGQYLQPSPDHLPVAEFVAPERFDAWKDEADAAGFLFCASGPLVRSSYRAGELFVESYLRRRGAAPPARFDV
ncbi:MAG TPA: radical SAM protein, partial [Planctomycetota bacterium]|nr:radical SAM protein [Planctomycetota bacterium]